MAKKYLLILFISLFLHKLPLVDNSFELHAGIVKYSIKKLIIFSAKKALSENKNSIREHYKEKLLNYLHKHPEFKDQIVVFIKKHIQKHPKYQERGFALLQSISNKFK